MKESLRNRILTFRLTDAQYRTFREECAASGQGLSAIVRQAVLNLINRSTAEDPIELQLNSINGKLDRVLALLEPRPGTDGEPGTGTDGPSVPQGREDER